MKSLFDETFKVKLIERKNGGSPYPKATDVLKYVGLDQISETQFYKIYDELFLLNKPKKILRYIAYLQDVPVKIAREKLIRYYIIYTGLEIKYATSDVDRFIPMNNCLYELSCELDCIKDLSTEFLLYLFRREGFVSKEIDKTLKEWKESEFNPELDKN